MTINRRSRLAVTFGRESCNTFQVVETASQLVFRHCSSHLSIGEVPSTLHDSLDT